MIKIPKDKPVQVLSIGTKILLKDVMDTFLRSLGEVKTFYAYKQSTALETYNEKQPNIVFCEQAFPEGSALEFIRDIGGLHPSNDSYFVLATEGSSDELVALAMEKGVDEILVKPFATENIQQIVERYFEKRAASQTDWTKALRTAKQSFREKRFQESEELMMAAVKKFPDNTSVLLEAAEFFLGRNYPQNSFAMLEKLLKDAPDNTRCLHLMGSTLRKLGRAREAADYFLRAAAQSPLNSMRNVELAETYVQLADEQIQAALKNENDNTSLILTKAKFQLIRKDYAGLVAYLDTKRAFLSDAGKKEADVFVAIAKRLGGIK
jgi:DNA-binding NarL/FixJ family response regulator